MPPIDVEPGRTSMDWHVLAHADGRILGLAVFQQAQLHLLHLRPWPETLRLRLLIKNG